MTRTALWRLQFAAATMPLHIFIAISWFSGILDFHFRDRAKLGDTGHGYYMP